MDAFYASIEQRDHPELRGKPVIVGGSREGRGVVSAASYEARRYGIHSAMPAATAIRLCPQAIILPVRMKHYMQIGYQIREIFQSFTPLVQPLSLDEAFLDVHGCEGIFGPAIDIGQQIKARIKQETGLIASVGVSFNKYLAKLASDLGKPDGFVVIPKDQVREILDPLPVGKLWGVGAKAEKRLHRIGLKTIGQIAALPEKTMADSMGDAGRHIWRLATGLDQRSVTPDEHAKSVSTETTFSQDIGDRPILRNILLELVEHLGQRLRAKHFRARTIDIKVRSSDFTTYTRSVRVEIPTDITSEIWQCAARLFDQKVADHWLPVRLLGVGASGLTRDNLVQGDLFEEEWKAKQHSLDLTVDSIRKQFGNEAINRGRRRDRRGKK